MPISHNTKWYGVEDAKIRKVTADPAGGVATYGSRIDVPGMKSVGITGDVNSTELRGDNIRLDQNSNLAGLSLSFEFAKQALDIMAALAGGTVADGGTGSTETVTWKLTAADTMSYFEFEAMTKGVDTIGGDGHMIIHKAILSGFPEIGFAEEDYKTYTVEAAVLPLQASTNGDILSVILNETAVAIPSV